jgi:hypothetical protein
VAPVLTAPAAALLGSLGPAARSVCRLLHTHLCALHLRFSYFETIIAFGFMKHPKGMKCGEHRWYQASMMNAHLM